MYLTFRQGAERNHPFSLPEQKDSNPLRKVQDGCNALKRGVDVFNFWDYVKEVSFSDRVEANLMKRTPASIHRVTNTNVEQHDGPCSDQAYEKGSLIHLDLQLVLHTDTVLTVCVFLRMRRNKLKITYHS